MWFFIVLLILWAFFKLGEWSFYLAIFGLLLFFVNWLINKLLKLDEMVGDRERAMVVVLKGIIFILLFFWFW
jgi:hypothetical protein